MNIYRFFHPDVEWAVTTLPDTALLIKQRPFFIPDFADSFVPDLCCAVRVIRLGRSIDEQFAHRYYDKSTLTLAAHFVARDLFVHLQEGGVPTDVAVGFDNALAVAERGDLMQAGRATLSMNGEVCCGAEIAPDMLSQVDVLLARTSRYYTFRQGDILLVPLACGNRPVQIGDRITLALDNSSVWAFNAK